MTDSALYIVATPIGNLGDMVPRAIETLQMVDVIAAEDTRHSARLLEHFHISTPMIAYHDHSNERQIGQILERLQQGESIALISDAGTPLISDPGYRLVRAVRDAAIKVVPIPGASAVIAALSVSGLPSDRFTFEGFLPSKSGQRQNQLIMLKNEIRTMVFYEAPHRVLQCLTDMAVVFGEDREAVLARELTKQFETIASGSLASLAEFVACDTNQQRGEIVLLIKGYKPCSSSDLNDEAQRVMEILLEQLSVKQAASLGAKITGYKKKVLYEWALQFNR